MRGSGGARPTVDEGSAIAVRAAGPPPPPHRARSHVRERIPFCGAGAGSMAWGWTPSERTASRCRVRVPSGGVWIPLCVYMGEAGSRYGAGGRIPQHDAGSPCRSCDPPIAGLGPGAGRWDPMMRASVCDPVTDFLEGLFGPPAGSRIPLHGVGWHRRGWDPLHRRAASRCRGGDGSHYILGGEGPDHIMCTGGWIPLYVCLGGCIPLCVWGGGGRIPCAALRPHGGGGRSTPSGTHGALRGRVAPGCHRAVLPSPWVRGETP